MKFTSAVATDRQVLDVLRRAYGPSHHAVAGALLQLGQHLHRSGQLAEAETSIRESIAMRERLYGAENEGNSGAQVDLAMLLADRGDYRTAE